ncbi:MAG: hypothetical protein AABY32_04655 [Nanoarchaeota archaeon]
MKTKVFISVILILVSFFAACEKEPHKSKKSNFESPEEFLENPSVQNAINESDMPIYYGKTPPVLSGKYSTDGSVTDASSVVSELIGLPITSTITLYNQTASGKISFKEEISGIVAWGTGGYIIGENGKFSIFQESLQNGEEAGLPSDLSITVILVMSGTKYSQGDLIAKGISIITKATSPNSEDYDLEALENVWWMWEADFYLEGPASKSSLASAHSLYFPDEIKEIIRNFKLK